MTPTNCFTWLCCYTHICWRQSCKQQKINYFCIKKFFFFFIYDSWMRQWKCLFNLWNNLWKKAPFSIFGPKSWKHFFIFIKQGVLFHFRTKGLKVFLYIYETRLRKWKYFFIFMKQGWESESISLHLWNKVQKTKLFFLFSWNKVQKMKVFLYCHETMFGKWKCFFTFHETRFRKWKFFFIFMKQGSESENVSLIFMKQGSESESVSLFSWNEVEKCNE